MELNNPAVHAGHFGRATAGGRNRGFSPQNVRRIFRAYGTQAEKMFDNARFATDMGKSFGPLSEREINYLIAEEFVREPDDILWRRSKLGLHLSADEQKALREHMKPAVKEKSSKRAKG